MMGLLGPLMSSLAPMLVTFTPMALAEAMTSVWFSLIWNRLSSFPPFGLLSARTSMVSFTATLINLASRRPSCTLDSSSSDAELMGSRWDRSGSDDR